MNADINFEYIDGQNSDGNSALYSAFNSLLSNVVMPSSGGGTLGSDDYLALESSIQQETNNRIAQDSSLSTRINNEVTNRINADTNLQTQITQNSNDIDILNARSLQDVFDTNPSDLNLQNSGRFIYIDNLDQTATLKQVTNKAYVDVQDSYLQTQINQQSSKTLQQIHTQNPSNLNMGTQVLTLRENQDDVQITDYEPTPWYLTNQITSGLDSNIQTEVTRATNAETGLQNNKLDKTVTLSDINRPLTSVNLDNQKIINLANATLSTDAINKGQLDSVQTTLQSNIDGKYDKTTTLNNIQKATGTLDLNNNDIIGIATLYTNNLDTSKITSNQIISGDVRASNIIGDQYVTSNNLTASINTESIRLQGLIENEQTRAQTAEQALLDQIVDKMSVFTKLNEIPLADDQVDLNNNRIINLMDPVNPQDATTKNYVDGLLSAGTSQSLNQIHIQNPSNLNMGTNKLFLRLQNEELLENYPDEQEAVMWGYIYPKLGQITNDVQSNREEILNLLGKDLSSVIIPPQSTIEEEPTSQQETIIFGAKSNQPLSSITKMIISNTNESIYIQNADLDMQTNRIKNLQDAVDSNDGVNKQQLDQVDNGLQLQIDTKRDISDSYSIMQIDGLLTERDNLIDTKRNISDSYDKTEVNTLLNGKMPSNFTLQDIQALNPLTTALNILNQPIQTNRVTFQGNHLIPKSYVDTQLLTKLDASSINNYSTTTQMNTAIANDFKNKIRFDGNEKCKIECTGDNAIQFKSNDTVIGQIYQPVGQATTPFGILSTDKIQLQSNLSSISAYGGKPVDTNPLVLNTHGFYVSGIDNPTSNTQAIVNVATANSAQLYLSSGHLLDGTKYSALASDSQLTISSSLNPQANDSAIQLYTQSQAQAIPITFSNKAGYDKTITIDQPNQFVSKTHLDTQLATKLNTTTTLNQISAPTAYLSLSGQRIVNLGNPISGYDGLNRITGDGRYYLNTTVLNSITAPTGSLSMNSQKIINLANPVNSQDATTKNYVDTQLATVNTGSTTPKLPIGTILQYYSNTIPSGFLLCDGSTFDQTVYPDLYAFLGNSNILPDFRGYFLRGLDPRTTGKIDPDGPRALGSIQTSENLSHTHTYQDVVFSESASSVPQQNTVGSGNSDGDNEYRYRTKQGTSYLNTADSTDPNTQINTSQSGTTESRPINKAINFIICASSNASGISNVNMSTSSDINMSNTYKIINLIDGTLSSDSCTYGQLQNLQTTLNQSISNLSSVYMPIGQSLSSISAPTTTLNLNNQRITNLALPTISSDAVNLQYITNQGYYNSNSSIPRIRFDNTTSLIVQFPTSSSFKINKQGQSTYYHLLSSADHSLEQYQDIYMKYGFTSGATLQKLTDTAMWLTRKLWISNSSSLTRNSNVYISRQTTDSTSHCLHVHDPGSGSYNNSGCYFDCYCEFNRTCQFNQNMYITNLLQIGNWLGGQPSQASLIVKQNNSTDNLSIEAQGDIVTNGQFIQVVPVSMQQYKKNIVQSYNTDLKNVKMYHFKYDKDKLQQDGYQNINNISDNTQIGFLIEELPERFHKQVDDKFKTINNINQLKDELLGFLLEENRQLQQKCQDLESRLKYIETYLFSKLE